MSQSETPNSRLQIKSKLYTLPLGGVDIVVGFQRLQTLGTYSTNHQKHFIKFKWQGKNYKLHGFQPLGTKIVSSQQMEFLIKASLKNFINIMILVLISRMIQLSL